VLSKLAEADFARTKALTEKFERPEFRLTAKLLLLRSLLKPQESSDAVVAVGRNDF
jgi:hypothetical protein